MEELTRLIQENIKNKYINSRRFAEELNIPPTTLMSSLKNGVGGTSFYTVMRICKALDIKLFNGIYPMVVSDAAYEVFRKLTLLDEKGIHTVKTVVELEYLRTMAEQENIAVAEAFSIADTLTYEQLVQPETPTSSELSSILKALNETEDAMSEY